MSYEIKTLPSGIVIENRPGRHERYRWYIKGTYRLHNEGELAAEYINGDKFWCQHGKEHRLDGPAMEYCGNKYYYINGSFYKEEDYWNHPKVKEYMYLKEHPELEGFV